MTNTNMKFYESDYEEALIDLLQEQEWEYSYGGELHRSNKESLIIDDLKDYLLSRYPTLDETDIENITNNLRHTGGKSHFDLLRNTYKLIRDGYRYTRHGDGAIFDIEYIDFESPGNNIFRCVNQYEMAYGQKSDIRIPDVILFVNGIPLCILELKNPTDEDATIGDAYEQLHTRYLRDMPHLLR